jgi:pilus assembly protein Flp/PilA
MDGCIEDILKLNPRAGNKMKLKQFLLDDSGATAIEYALIAAGIALAIIVAVNTLGTTLANKFSSIESSLK